MRTILSSYEADKIRPRHQTPVFKLKTSAINRASSLLIFEPFYISDFGSRGNIEATNESRYKRGSDSYFAKVLKIDFNLLTTSVVDLHISYENWLSSIESPLMH